MTTLATQNPVLTNFANSTIAEMIKANNFIGDAFCGGIATVTIDTFQFPKFSFINARNPLNVQLNSGDPTPTVNGNYTLTSAATKELRLGAVITKQDIRQNPNGEAGARLVKTSLLMLQNLINWEAAVVTAADLITNTAAATTAFDDPGADIPQILSDNAATYQAQCGLTPNQVTMSAALYRKMSIAASWRNYVKGSSNAGSLSRNDTEAALQNLFGNPQLKLLIGAGYYNAALPDSSSTITGTSLWSATKVYLTYNGSDPMSSPRTIPAFGVAGDDNVSYTGTNPADPAAGVEIVQHKFNRCAVLGSLETGLIITGC